MQHLVLTICSQYVQADSLISIPKKVIHHIFRTEKNLPCHERANINRNVAKHWLGFLLWLRGIVVTKSSACRETATSAILFVYSIYTLLCVKEYLWKWWLPFLFPSSDLVILAVPTTWPTDWSTPAILITFIVHSPICTFCHKYGISVIVQRCLMRQMYIESSTVLSISIAWRCLFIALNSDFWTPLSQKHVIREAKLEDTMAMLPTVISSILQRVT